MEKEEREVQIQKECEREGEIDRQRTERDE